MLLPEGTNINEVDKIVLFTCSSYQDNYDDVSYMYNVITCKHDNYYLYYYYYYYLT